MAGQSCPGPLVWDMLAADLSSGEWRALERHLRVCPRCMEMLATGRAGTKASPAELGRSEPALEDAGTVDRTAIGPGPGTAQSVDADVPAAAESLVGPAADPRLTEYAQAEQPGSVGAREGGSPGHRRARWAAFAAGVTVVVLAVALAPVRSAAAGLLAQFRVHQIRAVAVDPSSMGAFEALAGELDEIISLQAVNGVAVDGGDMSALDQSALAQEVDDITSARDFLRFPPRLPQALGQPLAVEVAPGGEYRFRVDGTKIGEWAAAAGLASDGLPDSVGYVDVTAEAGFIARYQSTSGTIELQQLPVPEIAVPADWDLRALGELYLRTLGVSQYQARALATTIDWGSTLVVPFPAAESEALDVKVDGVAGVAFVQSRWQGGRGETSAGSTPLDSESGGLGGNEPHAVVVWQRDGMLYAVSGDLDPSALVAIAEDLS